MARLLVCALVLGALLAGGTGCTTSIGEFTVLSSKNMDMGRFDTSKGDKAKIVEGHDSKPIIFFISTGVPNLKEAVDRAEESGNACGLTNARLSYTGYWLVLFGDSRFDVSGNPITR